jgi:hypothetical protein
MSALFALSGSVRQPVCLWLLFLSPLLLGILSLVRFAGGGAEAIPCGLRSLLIVSWFSFIVTCLLRLVFWDDLRRPVYEMMMTNG